MQFGAGCNRRYRTLTLGRGALHSPHGHITEPHRQSRGRHGRESWRYEYQEATPMSSIDFKNVLEFAGTSMRTVLIYFFLLAVTRALGKRTLGSFTAFDLIVVLIISDVVGDALYDQEGKKLILAVAIIVTVAILHWLNAFLSARNKRIDQLLGGRPRILIKKGVRDQHALRAENISEMELKGMLREHGVMDFSDVKLGVLEMDGKLSVIKTQGQDDDSLADGSHRRAGV
jgi:uncharacterized membrane protein YcaP (DUF421 family)